MAESPAEALELFKEQVSDLAGVGVSARKQRATWELRFRPPSPGILLRDGFSCDSHGIRLGKTRVVADRILVIERVALVGSEFRILIRAIRDPGTLSGAKGADVVQALRAEAEGLLEGTRHEPLRSAFATRALRGIRRLAQDSALETIAEAVAAPTDTEAVVKALEQPDTLTALAEADPLLPARIRGLRERERLLSLEGGTWDTETTARHLHLTRQAVNRRRRLGTLLGIGVGRRGYRYPAWQFARVGTLQGIERVFAALVHHDPWMRAAFMLSVSDRLNARPLDALKAGRLDETVAAAQAFGEHGAG